MSDDAIDIYNDQLAYQLGEDGAFTEKAIYDPDGLATEIYGIYDDNTSQGDKDSGHVSQKITGPRFVVADISDMTYGIYEDKKLYLVKRDETYYIEYIDTDENGAQVIWLRNSD